MSAPLDLDTLEARIMTSSVCAWMETYGVIEGKAGSLIKPPDLHCNEMQRILDSILRWCEANGIPCWIIGLKARQVGLSTWSIGAAYHRCRRQPTNFLLIGDEYEASVANLENKFETYAEHDKFAWGNTYTASSDTFSNGSAMHLESANAPRAGAGFTFQFVVATEVAHWKNTSKFTAEKVFQSFMATVPRQAGTCVILESTANGEGNAFHRIYSGAISFADVQAGRLPAGWNGFIKVFYAWWQFPEYTSPVTPDEAIAIMATLDERERQLVALYKIDAGRVKWRRETIRGPILQGNAAKFEEEYPSSEADAFLATGSRVFPAPQIKEMSAIAASAVVEFACLDLQEGGYGRQYPAMRITKEPDAWLKIWERPTAGLRYIISVDPATGRTTGDDPDNHGIQVWRLGYRDAAGRWRPPLLVARMTDCGEELSARLTTGKTVAVCRWSLNLVESRLKMLCDWYGRAMLAIEANHEGGLIRNLMAAGYPVIRVQKYNKATQRLEDFYGLDTDGETRQRLISGLNSLVHTHDEDGTGISILDPVVIEELKAFSRLKTGRTEAAAGWHDDQVLSAAIAVECQQQASVLREEIIRPVDELTRIQRRQGGGRAMPSTYT